MNKSFDPFRAIPLQSRPHGYLFIEARNIRSIFYDCEIQFRCQERFITLVFQIMDIDRSQRSYSIMVFDETKSRQVVFAKIDYVDGWANTIDELITLIDPGMGCLGPLMLRCLHSVIYYSIIIDRTPIKEDGTKDTKWYILFSDEFADSVYESTGTRVAELINATSSLLQK
jgi:hypothetical protein